MNPTVSESASEELVGDVGVGARELVEQRRLAGVGVTHERHAEEARAHTPRSLRVAALRKLADLRLQLLHALADQAPVQLDLLLARAAGLAEAATLALEVRPAAHQARGEVLESRQFDLQLAFMRLGALREDVEDEIGPVVDHHRGAIFGERPFEVAHLRRRKRVVEHDHLRRVLAHRFADLVDLAGAHRGLRVRTVAAGAQGKRYFRARALDKACRLLGALVGFGNRRRT
jgi:hypothetical protein